MTQSHPKVSVNTINKNGHNYLVKAKDYQSGFFYNDSTKSNNMPFKDTLKL